VHFTLASEDAQRAMDFYSAVFDEEFSLVEIGDDTLFRGSLAGIGMVICPTQMADVVANRSRHQLQLEVDDVAAHLDRATASGGRVHTPLMENGSRTYAVVCDPDNNTLELLGTKQE